MREAEAASVEDIPKGMACGAKVLVAPPAQPKGRHSPHAGKACDLEFGIQVAALTFRQLGREIEEGCDVHEEICDGGAPVIVRAGTRSLPSEGTTGACKKETNTPIRPDS